MSDSGSVRILLSKLFPMRETLGFTVGRFAFSGAVILRILPEAGTDADRRGARQNMKAYAEKFYKSKTWNKTREAYIKSVGGLCEICLSKGLYNPGEIVHHIKPITPENISNPEITLNWQNLKLVCAACHAEIHIRKEKRYRVDAAGRVILPPC